MDRLVHEKNTPWIPNMFKPKYRCEKEGNGNLSVLVIGNSFAHAHYDGIERALFDQYAIIRFYGWDGKEA
uniref:Uncharacterized protein n=1 Tax=Acrobeloides nanus TaxID=290746 RepID=A0A914CF15_9BILA